MPTFRERLSSAWGAIRGYEATPIQGEVSMADPFRLWGGKDPVVPYNPSELIMKRGMRTLDEMRRECEQLWEAGVDWLALSVPGNDRAEVLANAESLAEAFEPSRPS